MNMPAIYTVARPNDGKGTSIDHVRELGMEITREVIDMIFSKLDGESLEAIMLICPSLITAVIDALDCAEGEKIGEIGRSVLDYLQSLPKDA
jgi:hypothetical protein